MNKRDKIKLMLQSTNMMRSSANGFKDLVNSLPDDKNPKLGPIKRKFLRRFDEVAQTTTEKQIDLYDRLLSEDAIDATIHFYSTREGQEIVKNLPKINEGLSKISFDFVSQLAKEFITELLELEPTEEEMVQMGFTKLSADLEDLEDDDEDDEDDDKIVPKDNPDDIDSEEFDRFFKDYGVN